VALGLMVAGAWVSFPGLTHLWAEPWVGKAGDSEPAVKLRAASIAVAHDTESESSTFSSRGETGFAYGRIAIISESDAPWMKLVARSLRDELAGLDGVRRVDLSLDGRFPLDESETPDVFIRLALDRFRATPVPFARSLEATIGVSAGRWPWESRRSRQDIYDAPLVYFDWSGTVRHSSKTAGYESVKNAMAAESLAKHVAEQLGGQFKEWRKKYPPFPKLPKAFRGRYRPPRLPEALARLKPQLVGSFHRPLRHNESFFRLTLGDDAAGTLTGLRDALEADGWRVSGECDDGERPWLWMRKDTRRIHISRPMEEIRSRIVWFPDRRPPQPLCVHYTERFSDEELKEVLEALLADPSGLETAWGYSLILSKDQRQRLYTAMENKKGRSLAMELRLLDRYLTRKDTDKARQSLRRANALRWGGPHSEQHDERIRDAAKKLGAPTLAEKAPSAADLREAGFIEIGLEDEAIQRRVGLDEPVAVFFRDAEGKLYAISLTVTPSGKSYVMRFVYRGLDGSTVRGSHEGQVGPDGRWSFDNLYPHPSADNYVKTRVTQSSEEGRFDASVSIVWIARSDREKTATRPTRPVP
jgi:hypothetical protein